MKAAVIWEKKCRIPELNPNSYIYAYNLSLHRMESTIQILERRGNPVFVLSQADLVLPVPGWTRTLTIDNLPIVEPSMTEQDYRFQRNYRAFSRLEIRRRPKFPLFPGKLLIGFLKTMDLLGKKQNHGILPVRGFQGNGHLNHLQLLNLIPDFAIVLGDTSGILM
jgi:hypothetical protein